MDFSLSLLSLQETEGDTAAGEAAKGMVCRTAWTWCFDLPSTPPNTIPVQDSLNSHSYPELTPNFVTSPAHKTSHKIVITDHKKAYFQGVFDLYGAFILLEFR